MPRKQRFVLMLVLVTAALILPATARAQSAWGGGCQGQFGTDICIAVAGPSITVHADFYVNDFNTVYPYGYGSLYICVAGTGCYYRYTALTDHYGHYPVGQLLVNGTGEATNEVDFFDSSFNYITTGVSPVQYWAP